MVRVVSALLLLAGALFAHGGMYRPPPRVTPRDPVRPPARPGAPVTKAGTTVATPIAAWEAWWYYNRERYLRIRERMTDQVVVTPKRPDDLFDRAALRRVLLPELLKALGDGEEEVRTAAAVALGKFRAKEAVPRLWELYGKDDVKQVREAAVIGLLLMRDEALAPRFEALALDAKTERRVRCFAVLGLGMLRRTAFLSRLLKSRDQEEVRACAAMALGFSGSMAAVEPLLAAATDRRAPFPVLGFAGPAVGRLRAVAGAGDMLDLIRSRNAIPMARYGAAIALGALVEPTEGGVLDLLGKHATKDRDLGVRILLTLSLGRIGGDRAATHLVTGLKRGFNSKIAGNPMPGYNLVALGLTGSRDAGDLLALRFEELKNNSDRAACAIGLGLNGHTASAKRIREETVRGNPDFAPHGMVALALLGDKEAVPVVERLLKKKRDLKTRREGVIALALLRGPAAVPVLVERLEQAKSTFGRAALAQALGMVGTERAVDPLLAILRDEKRSGEERAIALAALGRMGDDRKIPLLSEVAFDLNPFVTVDAVTELVSII